MEQPFLDYAGGVLRMEGVPLAELAERLGSPFFLISASRLRNNYQALARGLAAAGPGTVLRYCAKTNREAAVLEVMGGLGSHLLASHAAEAALAVRCGFPPERIAYARPVLTPEELDAALGLGVPLFHVHHPDDLGKLETAAAQAGRPVRVSFRLRGAAGLSPLGRLNRRLGLDADEIVEAARRAMNSPWLTPTALNFYLGTQQSSLDGFAHVFRGVLALLRRLASETGVVLREVNLGGGIPSPTLRRVGPRHVLGRLRDRLGASSSGNLETFAARLGARFRELVDASGLSEPPGLAAEPGRSIVGDAAVLVTRVRAVRGRWLFLDASRNHLPESPVLFARRILPLAAGGGGGGAERFWNLSGCTLNTLDVLDLHRRLPPLAPGDGIAFCDAGAYSISRASSYAGLSPAVYLLEADGTVRLARRAEDVEDLSPPLPRRRPGEEGAGG
jgi:diaminopimelate decarboxylase